MRNWRKALLATAGICFLLLSTAGEGLALNWGSKEVETEKVAVKLTREVLKGGYGIVTTDELKQWLDQGKQPLIIDTMPYEDSFAKEHIPGAVHFEFPIEEVAQLDAQTREEYVKLLGTDKDRLLVIYCGFTKCGRSHNGALWAKQLGYTNVFRHPGGIKAWQQAGYPAAKVR
jgi:rhodanese-related sulfurtransferase